MTTAKVTARYSAMEGARAVTFAIVELHHYPGRDRLLRSGQPRRAVRIVVGERRHLAGFADIKPPTARS